MSEEWAHSMGSFKGLPGKQQQQWRLTGGPQSQKYLVSRPLPKKKKFADPWEVFSKWDVILGE